MLDPLVRSLTNQIAREGINGDTNSKLVALMDTILNVNDFTDINVVNIQTLLLLLQDFEIKSVAKRLVNEVRYKLIRVSLGFYWQNGLVVSEYNLSEMNRDVLTKIDKVSVFESGAIIKETQFSIQPVGVPADELLLNDFGQIALDTPDASDELFKEKDIVLALEKFKMTRVGCCGLARDDMVYPIGETCEEADFIREALSLAKSYGVGTPNRTADTYAIEYFLGKPAQNFRDQGKSLFLFELQDDNLWHYYRDGEEMFAKNLEGVELEWRNYLK